MNTAARRFPSITNEDAIRPHEHAFRRWSSPDFGGSAYAAPMIPDAAATERADTMAVHHPPTFKVYTPQEVRRIPFRKSMPAYEELRSRESDGVGARTLLKWTGIGIVAGLAVLTALIVVLNFGGDRAFASINMRSALMGNKSAEPAAAPAKPAAAPVTIAETKPAPKAALELPATKPAAPTKAAAPKTAAKKR